jgi:hypothetical protein
MKSLSNFLKGLNTISLSCVSFISFHFYLSMIFKLKIYLNRIHPVMSFSNETNELTKIFIGWGVFLFTNFTIGFLIACQFSLCTFNLED